MPPEDLTEVLTRLRSDAEGGLHESSHDRDSRETDEEARRRYRLALDTRNGLLACSIAKKTGNERRQKASAPR